MIRCADFRGIVAAVVTSGLGVELRQVTMAIKTVLSFDPSERQLALFHKTLSEAIRSAKSDSL